MTTQCDPEFIRVAEHLADAARPIARRYFRAGVQVDQKADNTMVTTADQEIETVMRGVIGAAFPGHKICGEEQGGAVRGEGYQWVLDPIDGTSAFVMGVPTFGTLIALARDGVPILGIIDQPIAGERWVGASGRGATFNGARINTRNSAGLKEALVLTTSPEYFEEPRDIDAFNNVAKQARSVRYGADCYGFGLVAMGYVDLVVEASLKPWDYAAVIPVVCEAGGIVTDWRGAPVTLESDGHVLAAGGPTCHAAALSILATA
ncbi:histidinol-phosphatase [Alphaproteobacteria bacterium]|nr:histidinol-phosphatase [Alphaproteobacteria bacterium]